MILKFNTTIQSKKITYDLEKPLSEYIEMWTMFLVRTVVAVHSVWVITVSLSAHIQRTVPTTESLNSEQTNVLNVSVSR